MAQKNNSFALFIVVFILFLTFNRCNSTEIPNYSGLWKSEGEIFQIKIEKLNNNMFDLKYFNPANGFIEPNISGAYTLGDDYLSISKPVSLSALDYGKVYQFTWTEKGKLYIGGKFFSKTE